MLLRRRGDSVSFVPPVNLVAVERVEVRFGVVCGAAIQHSPELVEPVPYRSVLVCVVSKVPLAAEHSLVPSILR